MAYQRCTRCVMDNVADEEITFAKDGNCNYCSEALERKREIEKSNSFNEARLEQLLYEIRTYRKKNNNEFDCVMGISGGIDSAYLTHLAIAKWKLKVALIHIDDGFNTNITNDNIKVMAEQLKPRLAILKPDTKQFNNLIKAYMRAGVPNLAAPQDNVLFAFIYDFVKKNKLKYFLSGGNFATESILQKGNTYTYLDLVNLKDINNKFGEDKLDKLKFTSFRKRALDQLLIGLESPRPLDMLNYNSKSALKELEDNYGFQYYGQKHHENYLTMFNQVLWLPKKFNVDKRKSHLSSMIISGQMTREKALSRLEANPCGVFSEDELIEVIGDKLGMERKEIKEILTMPGIQHGVFRTDPLYALYKIVKQ